jgi:hypothetical protein
MLEVVDRVAETGADALRTALFVGLGLVVAASVAAMAWTTRGEIRRRRSPSRELMRPHDTLTDVGYSFLCGGAIVLSFAVLAIDRQGAAVVPGLLTGGAAALSYALALPLRLAALAKDPETRLIGLQAQRLFATVVRLRKPWLPVVATAPFFGGIALYLHLSNQPVATPSAADFGLGALFGVLAVGMLAWGVQCVQVLRALQREAQRA